MFWNKLSRDFAYRKPSEAESLLPNLVDKKKFLFAFPWLYYIHQFGCSYPSRFRYFAMDLCVVLLYRLQPIVFLVAHHWISAQGFVIITVGFAEQIHFIFISYTMIYYRHFSSVNKRILRILVHKNITLYLGLRTRRVFWCRVSPLWGHW